MKKFTPFTALGSQAIKMPVIGLGTWQSTNEEIECAVNAALEHGYRHIDTAFAYMNEAAIGRVLQKWFSSGRLCRDEVFIVTKLPPHAIRRELVGKFLKKSLDALQLEYVDLYLVHSPVGFQYKSDNEIFPVDENGQFEFDMETDHLAVWQEMEKQVDGGRTKSIGISNFNIKQIDQILQNCRIHPSNLQVEMHVYLQQKELVDYCAKNRITLCAYAPLGSPALSAFMQKNGLSTVDLVPLSDPVVNEIAEKHGKTPANVLLRFLVQLGAAVIPKSTNPERIKQNFQIFDFELNDDEMALLKSLDKGKDGRMFQFPNGSDLHPEFPYADELD